MYNFCKTSNKRSSLRLQNLNVVFQSCFREYSDESEYLRSYPVLIVSQSGVGDPAKL